MIEEVHFTGLSVHAEGVGRLKDGRVVFVDGALPGDVALVRPVLVRHRLVMGELVEPVAMSVGRVKSGCDIEACGGCPLRGCGAPLMAQIKHRHIADCFMRIAKIDVSDLLVPVTTFGDGWGYRHRVRLHAQWTQATQERAQGWLLGYHARRSHQLVPLSACPVIWPELERLGRAVAGGLARLPQEADIESVEIAYSRRDQRGGARVVARGPIAAMRRQLDWIAGSELLGIEVQAKDGRFRWGNCELRYDHKDADAFDLRFEAGLFTQAHTEGNDALVAHVLHTIGPKNNQKVLEMHAGIGNFTVPLARMGARVTAVERHRRTSIILARNARNAGVDVEVLPVRDIDAADRLAGDTATLLLDPSRQGARGVIEKALASRHKALKQIVYVSCDMATLARDVALLAQAGWQTVSMRAFDLFPQTPHVEAVVSLRAP